MYWRYYKQARKRGYCFELTVPEFINLVTAPMCRYCRCKPYQTAYGFLVLGIDRIENDKGYTIDNCAPCCKDCNFKKGTGSIDRLLNILYNG